MRKYGVAALIAGLYVIGSVAVVQWAGKSYRESLVLEEVRDPAPAVVVQNSDPQLAPPPPPTEPIAPKPPPATVESAPNPKDPEPQPPSTALTSTSAAKPVPAAPSPQPHAASTPSPSPPPPRNPALAWADTLDLAHLKPEEERRLGRELHALVLSNNKPSEDTELQERVERVGRPLLAGCARKDVEYTFTVLDSDAVNAFSFPGGYVYICRGLFDLIGDDEDYALEFVLAHEIAHVDAEHARKFAEKVNAEEKKNGLGTLLQFYLLVAFGYPDDLEFEADSRAFRQMNKLDRTKREALAFLRKFKKHAERNGFGSGRKPPPPGQAGASAVENHFRALPATWKRLDRLQK